MEEAITIRKQDLAVAAWLQTRDQTLAVAAKLGTITTDAEFDQAGQLINACSHLCKELEAERKKLTAPLDAIKKDIMAQEKKLSGDIIAEQTRLRSLANAYATRKAAEREAAERAAREAEAAAAEQAADMAAKAREAFGAFDGVADNPPFPAAPVTPIVPPKPQSTSVKQVTVYTFEVTDAAKLDRKFLSVDEGKIRAFCQYLKTAGIDPATVAEPGLVIKKEVRVDSK
jgi:hypothetical protein